MQPYRFLVVAWFAFVKYVGFTKSFFQVTDEGSLSLWSFLSFRFWFSLFRNEDKTFAMKKSMIWGKNRAGVRAYTGSQAGPLFFTRVRDLLATFPCCQQFCLCVPALPIHPSVSSADFSPLHTWLQHSTPSTGKYLICLLAQALQPSVLMDIY